MSAADFKGYLIKFPKTGQLFPHRLIQKDTYKATPLQRTDIKAYRDNDYLLHRTTSPNHKSKVEFSTYKLRLSQLEEIRTVLNRNMINTKERKICVEYWDDELLQYRLMTCYMPDTTYPVITIGGKQKIRYNAIKFSFIEY